MVAAFLAGILINRPVGPLSWLVDTSRHSYKHAVEGKIVPNRILPSRGISSSVEGIVVFDIRINTIECDALALNGADCIGDHGCIREGRLGGRVGHPFGFVTGL